MRIAIIGATGMLGYHTALSPHPSQVEYFAPQGTKCRHGHPNQFPSVPENCMNNSNSSSSPTSSRVTLKLKVAARKPSNESKAPPVPRPQSKPSLKPGPNLKPGAHWSDEYKRRMQADMDELISK